MAQFGVTTPYGSVLSVVVGRSEGLDPGQSENSNFCTEDTKKKKHKLKLMHVYTLLLTSSLKASHRSLKLECRLNAGIFASEGGGIKALKLMSS